MVKNGIDRIKISVSELDASVAFFRDTLEMTMVDEMALDARSMSRLWDLPDGMTARAAYLKNDEQSTMLELIQFSPTASTVIRSGARVYDYGLFDVAFRANDIDAVYEAFKAEGYQFISAPMVYTADWVNVTVKEVIMIGPNEMPIAFIERMTEPKPKFDGRFGSMPDSAQFVEDADAAAAFYTDVLGFKKVFDQDLPDGLIDGILGLPEGTRSRMTFLVQPEAKSPVVELIQTSAPGKNLSGVTCPPHIGLFGWALEVDDLETTLTGVKAAGYAMVCPPLEMSVGGHGGINTATIKGPNGIYLELFEK